MNSLLDYPVGSARLTGPPGPVPAPCPATGPSALTASVLHADPDYPVGSARLTGAALTGPPPPPDPLERP